MGLVVVALQAAVLLVLSNFLWQYFKSPLKQFPGPFLSSFTNIWRFLVVLKGGADREQQRLHRQYGKYVRLGPNCLSISDAGLIKAVYPMRNAFVKVRRVLKTQMFDIANQGSCRATSTRFPTMLVRARSSPVNSVCAMKHFTPRL